MPIYHYQCDDCGHEEDEFQHIHDESIADCPTCQGHYHRVPSMGVVRNAGFRKAIEMHSIALSHPDDVDDFKRRNPDVQCSNNPKDPLYGVPIAHTRQEKLAILKSEHCQEAK